MKVEDVEDENVNGFLKQEKKLEMQEKMDEKEDDEKDEKDKKDKKKDEKTESVGLFELFKFVDKLDAILILIGVVSAIICGCIFSAMFIMFGDVTDVLAQYNPGAGPGSGNDAFLKGMNLFAVRITFVGIGILITHYIFVAAFNYSAERQVEL